MSDDNLNLVKKEERVIKGAENIAVGGEPTIVIGSHLGNNAIGVAPRASIFHIGGSINGGGVGDNTVSVASGASTIVIGGNLRGGYVGEGIHLSVL